MNFFFILGSFFSFDACVFNLFILYVFRFFSIYLFVLFFLCRSLDFQDSHHIPKRQQKKSKNPKSKLQNPDQKASKRVCPTRVSAHPSAQQLRPQRLKHLNPLLPFILMKKLGSLPHIFHVFPVIEAAVFFCAVHWISHHIPKRLPKKIARVPPRGPFPLWENRISPL